jgi:hypothetical protein
MEDEPRTRFRIEEPFLKVHLALWLAARGATHVRVSVDGAEPNPDTIRQRLLAAGYSHTPIAESRAVWTGAYARGQTQITVVSRPSIDVTAALGEGTTFVAECKGEPTAKGIKAGDVSPLPQEKALAIPATARLRRIAQEVSRNPLVQTLGITLLLVDAEGNVARVGEPSPPSFLMPSAGP